MITENVVLNNREGIDFWIFPNGNIVDKNIVSNNIRGIELRGAVQRNTFSNNNITNNVYGFYLYAADYNTIANNTLAKNGCGICIFKPSLPVYGLSSFNIIYNNNFIDNQSQAIDEAGNNIFNLEAPTGGNYWSDFDTPVEGCSDINSDGFCDIPYGFPGGIDYLPWKTGWLTAEDLIQNAIFDIAQLVNSGDIASEGIATSLTSMLENASNAFQQGNIHVAENMLQALINKVEAQAGKQITSDAVAQLVEAARQIIGTM